MSIDLLVALAVVTALALVARAAIKSFAKPVRGTAAAGALPYRLRPFLSAAESRFFHVLKLAVNEEVVICPKVRLMDIFDVGGPKEGQTRHRNRISQKHVDFLLCDPTMVPICAVELDDSSHRSRRRQDRDRFVDEVFRHCGLKLVHVRAARAYDATKLREAIAP